MSYLKSPNSISAGAPPQTRLGDSAPPDRLYLDSRGPTYKERGGKGKGGMGKGREVRKGGRKGRGKRGRGRGEGRSVDAPQLTTLATRLPISRD